jgi:hypothetical protein
VLPSSEYVLAAENALQWDFPGRAVEIAFDEFLKESFRESLVTFLEQASMESLKRFEAHSAKAKACHRGPGYHRPSSRYANAHALT